MKTQKKSRRKESIAALLVASMTFLQIGCGTQQYPGTASPYYNPAYTNGAYTPNISTPYSNTNSLGFNPVVANNLPTGTIMGKVVDSMTKNGLAGARIEVVGVRPPITTVTDAAGNFTLANVPQGRQVLNVQKNEYTNVQGNSNIVVEATAGSTVSVPKSIELVPFRASSVNGFIKAFNNFTMPRGIAIAPSTGNIYVVDIIGAGGLLNYQNAEIKKLNADGGIIDNFGGRLLSTDIFRMLKQSNGVGVDSGGNIFVADTGHNQIRRYGPSGRYVNSIKAGFSDVFDVAVLTTGDVVVSDPGNGRVVLFDSSMNLKVDNLLRGRFSSNGLRGLATDNNDNIYVTDSSAPVGQVIRKFDKNGNPLPMSFGRIGGIQPGHFNNPTDLALDSRNGDLYVTDTGNNRIQRFDSEGNYLSEFGSFGTDNGRFNAPWGIAIDHEGFVFVTDSKNQRVQKFAPGRLNNG